MATRECLPVAQWRDKEAAMAVTRGSKRSRTASLISMLVPMQNPPRRRREDAARDCAQDERVEDERVEDHGDRLPRHGGREHQQQQERDIREDGTRALALAASSSSSSPAFTPGRRSSSASSASSTSTMSSSSSSNDAALAVDKHKSIAAAPRRATRRSPRRRAVAARPAETTTTTVETMAAIEATASSTAGKTCLTVTAAAEKVTTTCHSSSSSSSKCSSKCSSSSSSSSVDAESCFICLGSFSSKHPRMALPCRNLCNKSPVHGKCIYEWSECKQSRKNSTCPLCRGPLAPIDYVPRDKIGSYRFGNFALRRDFITRPVPKDAGVVRCYVRAVRSGYLGASTRYELYLQAPTTLKYPLGPLPSAEAPKQGDILLAVSHKHVNRWGCTQLDITMDAVGRDFNLASENYLGCVCSSFTGLEHTLVAPVREGLDGQIAMCELGAVRYTQNRIGRAVGPRRIHVCFPRVVKSSAGAQAPHMQQQQQQQQQQPLSAVVPFGSLSAIGQEEQQQQQHAEMDHEEDDEDLCSEDEDTAAVDDSDSDDEQDQQQQQQQQQRKTGVAVAVGKQRRARWATLPYRPERKQESLSAVLRAASQGCDANVSDDYMFGCNKSPYWLPAINAFSLDFGGRVTLPSNKNFQLIMKNRVDEVALQFGKIADSEDLEMFTLDVAWPLSPLQAFGVCLSACDRKLLCA